MDLSFYSQCLWFYLTHEPLFIFCGRVPLVDERLVLLLYCVFSGMVTFTPFYLYFYCIWSIVINCLFYFTFYLLLLKKRSILHTPISKYLLEIWHRSFVELCFWKNIFRHLLLLFPLGKILCYSFAKLNISNPFVQFILKLWCICYFDVKCLYKICSLNFYFLGDTCISPKKSFS